MSDFTFIGKERTLFIGLMLVGAISLVVTYLWGDTGLDGHQHTRFWSNLLHNCVFFTGIAFMAMFAMCAFITAYAGWYVVMKRLWEAFSLFLVVGLGLMGLLGVANYLGLHHLYHWNMEGVLDPTHAEYDELLVGKASFLNKNFYLFGTLIIVGIWTFFAFKVRGLSLAESDKGAKNDFSHHYKIRWWAACFLPIAAFTSAAMIWQWVMSIDSHWYSTMFAWYSSASWFVAMLCLTILCLVYLKSRGYFQQVTAEHFHDIGKFLFAFSIFWTYLWFSQYMLIWYGNVGEETVYFHTRQNEYPVLFWGNLAINFILPFFILMRNDTKRKYGTLIFVSVVVFLGHWWDYFYMIKPGVLETAQHISHIHHGHGDGEHGHGSIYYGEGNALLIGYEDKGDEQGHDKHSHDKQGHESHGHEAHGHDGEHHGAAHGGEHHDEAHGHEHGGHGHGEGESPFYGFVIPGFLEIGTMLGFLGLFFWFVWGRLASAPLDPLNDPYAEESVNHHT